jgi:hypothetical protein
VGGIGTPAGGPTVAPRRSEAATADTTFTLTGLAAKPLRGNAPLRSRCSPIGELPDDAFEHYGCRGARRWVKMGAFAQDGRMVQHCISPQICYVQVPQWLQPVQPGTCCVCTARFSTPVAVRTCAKIEGR